WPGPLTMVLRASAAVPEDVTSGTGTVAVRVPARRLTRALCAEGPLVSTSANLAGAAAPATLDEAVAGVGGAAGLALDGGRGRGAPSTLVDLTADEPRLVREG